MSSSRAGRMLDSKHVLIVGSAPVSPDEIVDAMRDGATIICADGGADMVLAAGLLPTLVVGDLDSITATGRERVRAAAVPVAQHPPEKDQTDLELALGCALELAPERITILGALGGRRFDHALGNVLLLAHPMLRDVDVRIVDAHTEVLVLWGARTFRGRPGAYLSLLPLTPEVRGISTIGLRYPLHDDVLLQGFTRGVSNEFIAEEATIRVREGCLLVVHER